MSFIHFIRSCITINLPKYPPIEVLAAYTKFCILREIPTEVPRTRSPELITSSILQLLTVGCSRVEFVTMETIFDIFGSRDSIKPSSHNLNQKLPAIKAVPSSDGVLSGKQSIRNEGSIFKGKKVLGDVGNKIKGQNMKLECNSNDTIKKPLQCGSSAPKISQKICSQVNETVEKNSVNDKQLTSQLIWEDHCDFSNLDKWPEVETQGSSFWSDDHYESMWPDVETPSVENYCCAANIWDIGRKYTTERSPSPLFEEFDDNIDVCLDLPSNHATEMVLEKASVKFPWEM